MSLFFGSIVKKIVNNIINKTTNANKASNITTIDVVKDSLNSIKDTNITSSSDIDTTINNIFEGISGKDKLKGVLFTKLIKETNELIEDMNQNKKKILNNLM